MEVISINRIASAALAAVQAGKSLEDGCPWPRESDAWPIFKLFFVTYRDHSRHSPAALAAEQRRRTLQPVNA